MSLHEPVHSDEPTRVRQLVSQFFDNQSGADVGPDGLDVLLSVGADARDDCAVYDIGSPMSLVVGSDYVRGPKFILHELGHLSDFDIGYYLAVANISDIAAMGATPIGLLSVIRYPHEMDDAGFRQVVAGIHQACADFGTLNVGGDIGNAERLILSGTALGVCPPGKVLRRSGARPGDLLCVTGACGLLGAAVAYFPRRGTFPRTLPADSEQKLLDSWKKPRARVAEGRVLARKPYATACQDTSDGLKATIEQLRGASGVGFRVNARDVPVDPVVRDVADLMGVDPLALTMSASSDFQLAFTVAADDLAACRAEFTSTGLDFTVIGEATEDGEALVVDDNGVRPLPGVAWKHQKSDISLLASGSEDT
ncbi:thiamine-phosphate kinase [Streptomyces sp. NBC_01498]|uniref:thiamine-phosphate kinase n=1 Tax=Streptomyces sp. NBC_01498 TaxID=2975870 RepID=UPI002E7BD5B6|nr:thiamine-phosphate kinase [Streptomyces sp. NBC_01498]WTL25004.1 thiamine-phosphate kinase [Streptomyces sp. NBC_01498]